MKKLLTLIALVGAASLSYGQGYISFVNGSTSKVSTNGVASGVATGGFYYGLFVAPSTQNTAVWGANSLAGWTYVSLGTNTSSAGRMTGNTTSDGALPIPGTTGTTTADFVVVGWSANLGVDYASVLQGAPSVLAAGNQASWAGQNFGYFGISAVANDIALAPTGGPYNGIFGAASGGLIPGMTLQYYSVPEPGTLALAGLGAAGMLIFRRRK